MCLHVSQHAYHHTAAAANNKCKTNCSVLQTVLCASISRFSNRRRRCRAANGKRCTLCTFSVCFSLDSADVQIYNAFSKIIHTFCLIASEEKNTQYNCLFKERRLQRVCFYLAFSWLMVYSPAPVDRNHFIHNTSR